MFRPSTHKTAQEWTDQNPILGLEVGYETDTGKYKRGDDQTRWNDLPYSPVQPYPNDHFVSQGSLDEKVEAILDDALDEALDEALPAAVDPRVAQAILASSVTVVDAGTNLSVARPAGAKAVYFRFSAGVNVGTAGVNVVNALPGDMFFVASA